MFMIFDASGEAVGFYNNDDRPSVFKTRADAEKHLRYVPGGKIKRAVKYARNR